MSDAHVPPAARDEEHFLSGLSRAVVVPTALWLIANTPWDVGCDVWGSGTLPLAGPTLPLVGLVLAASSIGGTVVDR